MLPHTDATPLYEISLAIVEEEEKQGAREESRVEAEKQQQPAAAATASPTPTGESLYLAPNDYSEPSL